MTKTILYLTMITLGSGCSRSGIDEINTPKRITQLNAYVATNATRVGLEVDPYGVDDTYWEEGDFLYVSEISQSGNLFTGHTLRYNYVAPALLEKESKGTFNGLGMVTGGKYLVVNTHIPYTLLQLPQLGSSLFQCTYKRVYHCTSSFGERPIDVQHLADELLFVGSTTIGDSDTDINIPLTSPMSMIEIRLTTDTLTDQIEKITIESKDEVFSYTIYTDQAGDSQSETMSNYYSWEKLNSEVVFTAGHYQSLNKTIPLKVRIVAFQKKNTTTSLQITAIREDGKTLHYHTQPQSRSLAPNAITYINAHVE